MYKRGCGGSGRVTDNIILNEVYIMEQMKKPAQFGINIKKYCREHEDYIRQCLDAGSVSDALLALHERRLHWLQHERLIHLIVVFIFAILFLFSVVLYIVLPSPYTLVLMTAVAVVLIAYIRHYFILENTTQRWYTLYDRIDRQLH
jgi:hypothetical protein